MLEINEELLAIDDAVDRLAKLILASPQAKNYQIAKANVLADQELQSLLARFQDLQESYEEQKGFVKYRSEVVDLRRQVLQLKRQIDLTQTMQEFRAAEVALQEVLAGITEQLAQTVSSDIFVDTGLPLAPHHHQHGHGRGQNIREKGKVQ
ncbi:YlbF family regulator [Streptococcus tangpeifui]|uniref:YlbF family regulator n=1 Tax=Streptococcus tangpeifui TaxID=2709400 RepID=UPI0013EC7BC5|nr:YlbF family regulator [Streptococcus sp. ZJ1593]